MNIFNAEKNVKQIYYKYFYQNCENRTFKSFVFYPIVLGKFSKNPELIDYLDIFKQLENTYDKKDYIIDDIHKFRFMTKFDDKYFEALNVFLLILEEFEKKEFFFNGYDKDKINLNLNFLIDYYQQKKYDLKSEEEFSKYNLIEINKYRKLHWQEARIIDEKYEITFDIKYITKKVYLKIFDLFKMNHFKLSFYPDCLNIKNYIDNSIMIFDEKEYGKKYNIDEIKKINLKENVKFVDYKIENKLYIKLVENELTFEEIQKDIKVFDDLNIIYTKVVHIIFLIEDETLYIEHIDLEYIFYTLDEYIERFDNDNFEQKGSRYKRQKIFKIDNAKINLVENLYDLVYNSLDNKNLVDEYFEMIN